MATCKAKPGERKAQTRAWNFTQNLKGVLAWWSLSGSPAPFKKTCVCAGAVRPKRLFVFPTTGGPMNNERLISIFLASKPGNRGNTLYDLAWYIGAMDIPKNEKIIRIKALFNAAMQRRGFGRRPGEIKKPGLPSLYNARQIRRRIVRGLARGLGAPYKGKTEIEAEK